MYGVTSFAIDPYQLGHGNKEGQESGAWWFYYKLGFRPQDPDIQALVRTELRKQARRRGHRTSTAQLNRLAAEYMFLQFSRRRRDAGLNCGARCCLRLLQEDPLRFLKERPKCP